MLFSDQVSILSNWFKNWNECEQTVALYSLLKKVQKRQAKFLARCLEHGLRDCRELGPVEEKANDAEFISSLLVLSDQEEVINILLSHLPLLKPGNDGVKSQYLKLLPKVLEFSVKKSQFLQESRQLLSYSLIHPAFDNDERTSLTSWMEHLDDRLVPENASKNAAADVSHEDVNHNRLWKDDPALIPPTSERSNSLQWQSGENGTGIPVSPGPRRDDSDSQTPADPNKSLEESAVAEIDFNPWLKSLRLHKYTDVFNSMTYDEVMQLTEEKLVEKKGVTKGARDKILLNIKKLHDRFERLQALEREICGGGSIRNALSELKYMICTPIKPFEATAEPIVNPKDPTPAEAMHMAPTPQVTKNEVQNGDIPAQFTKVLGKACTQLLISRPDKDNITQYMQMLDKCMQNNAFTPQQKKRLQSWKIQISKIQRSLPRNQQMSSQRSAVGSSYPNRRVTGRSLPSFGARVGSPVTSPSPLHTAPISMMPSAVVKPTWYGSGYGSNTQPTPHTALQPVDVARKTASLGQSFVQRSNAFPLLQNNENNQGRAASQVEQDISRRLDSLSLSVAEQALPGRR